MGSQVKEVSINVSPLRYPRIPLIHQQHDVGDVTRGQDYAQLAIVFAARGTTKVPFDIELLTQLPEYDVFLGIERISPIILEEVTDMCRSFCAIPSGALFLHATAP